jgi:hypothetical protein
MLAQLAIQEVEAVAAPSLKEILLDHDISQIIDVLGESDVLDVLGAERIMDYVRYLAVERTDMREPGSQRMIFRREVKRLADEINSGY